MKIGQPKLLGRKRYLGDCSYILNEQQLETNYFIGLANFVLCQGGSVFLGMRGDGDNRNLFFVWTVVPEYPVSGRGGLLRIGFEDFFSLGSYKTGKFVSLKALVSRIL